MFDTSTTHSKRISFFKSKVKRHGVLFSQIPGERMKMTDKQSVAETYVPDNFRLNSWLLKTELSMGAKLTYSVLASCCHGKDHAWPSQDYLAKCLSISVRTVQRYLKELVGYGLIKISRQHLMGQTRSVYIFLNNVLVSFESKKASKPDDQAAAKTTKTTARKASKTTNQGDKTAPPIIRKKALLIIITISPLPPKRSSAQQRSKSCRLTPALKRVRFLILEFMKKTPKRKTRPGARPKNFWPPDCLNSNSTPGLNRSLSKKAKAKPSCECRMIFFCGTSSKNTALN